MERLGKLRHSRQEQHLLAPEVALKVGAGGGLLLKKKNCGEVCCAGIVGSLSILKPRSLSFCEGWS